MQLVPVYLCYNPLEAEHARILLAAEGWEVVVHNQSSSAFPVHDDANARITLQVLQEHAENARIMLAQAKGDGGLQGEGHVVEP